MGRTAAARPAREFTRSGAVIPSSGTLPDCHASRMLHPSRATAGSAALALLVTMLVATAQPAAAAVNDGTITTTAGSHTVTATVSVRDASVSQSGKTVTIDVTYASPTATVSVVPYANDVILTSRTTGGTQTLELSGSGSRQSARVSASGSATGTFDVGLRGSVTADGVGATLDADKVTSFTVTRETRPWIEVWPGMPAVGATYKVSAGMERFERGTYVPAKGATVTLWFTPKGSTTAVRKKTVTLGSAGSFSASFTNRGPGSWEMRYQGDQVYSPSSAAVTMSNFSSGTHTATYTQKMKDTWLSATVKASDIAMTLKGVTATVDVRFRHNGTGVTWDSGAYLEARNATGETTQGDLKQISGGHYSGKIRFEPFTSAGMHTVGAITDVKVYYGPGGNDYDWHFTPTETMTPFVVRRTTVLDAGLSTSTPKKGREYTVQGRLRKLSVSQSNSASYQPAARALVRLSFDPAGSAKSKYVKSVRTNSEGRFSMRTTATRSGVWTARYVGTATTYTPSTDTVRLTVR